MILLFRHLGTLFLSLSKINEEKFNNGYSQIAERYRWPASDQYIALPEFLKMMDKPRGKKILDLGCGNGSIARLFAPDNKVVGIDRNLEMLQKARLIEKRYKHVVKYYTKDLTGTFPSSWRENFDIIFSTFVFQILESKSKLIKAFQNVEILLKDNGFFVFIVPHPCFEHLQKTPSVKRFFPKEYCYFNTPFKHKVILRTINGDYLRVYDNHYMLQDYIMALRKTGFYIDEFSEPGFKNRDFKKHLSLFSFIDKQFPFDLIIKARKFKYCVR